MTIDEYNLRPGSGGLRRPAITQFALEYKNTPPEIRKMAEKIIELNRAESQAKAALEKARKRKKQAGLEDAQAFADAIKKHGPAAKDPGPTATRKADEEISSLERKIAGLRENETLASLELLRQIDGAPGKKWIADLQNQVNDHGPIYLEAESDLMNLGNRLTNLVNKLDWLKAGGRNDTLTEAQSLRRPRDLGELGDLGQALEARIDTKEAA